MRSVLEYAPPKPATLDTPEGVVWRYGAGCLDMVLHHTRSVLPRYELVRARQLLETGGIPTTIEVRCWLPYPFSVLEERGMPCTVETMYQYWRVDHRSDRNTPVWVGTVIDIHKLVCHMEDVSGKRQAGLNLHRLHLAPGTRVYVHAGIIAEPCGPEQQTCDHE